jgi:hypothetical protein
MFRATLRYRELMPAELEAVVSRRYVEGQSWRRIAADLNLTSAQVRHRLTRARYLLVALALRATGANEIAGILTDEHGRQTFRKPHVETSLAPA